MSWLTGALDVWASPTEHPDAIIAMAVAWVALVALVVVPMVVKRLVTGPPSGLVDHDRGATRWAVVAVVALVVAFPFGVSFDRYAAEQAAERNAAALGGIS